MTRPLRLLVPDGTYHAVARGIDQGSLFRDDSDRQVFLRLLARVASRLEWVVLAYCLMDNHYHLLVRTPHGNLDRGMQQLNSGHAQAFNRRHGRIGPLFQGRYHGPLIQRDSHVLEVMRYIALNPVRGGVVRVPESWAWSSHPAMVGRVVAAPFLAVSEVLSWFGGSRAVYLAFVDAGHPRDELDHDGATYGDTEFAQAVLPDDRPSSEIARRDWTRGRPLLRGLLDRDDRGQAIATAYRRHGYPLSAIAVELGLHVSTVSRALRRFEQEDAA